MICTIRIWNFDWSRDNGIKIGFCSVREWKHTGKVKYSKSYFCILRSLRELLTAIFDRSRWFRCRSSAALSCLRPLDLALLLGQTQTQNSVCLIGGLPFWLVFTASTATTIWSLFLHLALEQSAEIMGWNELQVYRWRLYMILSLFTGAWIAGSLSLVEWIPRCWHRFHV